MSLVYIWELDTKALRDTCILLDIDGTVAPTDSVHVHPQAHAAVQELKKHNTVVLFSNAKNMKRNHSVAESLGVPYVRTSRRKPFPHVVHAMTTYNPHDLPIVVIGDLFVTDGLLALTSRSQYVRVKRIHEEGKVSIRRRLYFLLDDILSCTIAPLLFWLFSRK